MTLTPGAAPATLAATVGEETFLVPAGPVPRALLGACRPGPSLTPADQRDGWALYHLPGQDAHDAVVPVALRMPTHPDFEESDAMATAFLSRARSNPRAMGELQALLTLALERDGQEGQWFWGDVARAVYGSFAKSHHLHHIRSAAALLSRGQWPTFGADSGADSPQEGRGSPWGGPSLLHVDETGDCTATEPQRCRCPLTVTLVPAFARALAHVRHRVPATHLQLPQPGHTNAKGRRLSRAALLRVRTTALHHWYGASPDPTARAAGATASPVSLQQFLSRCGIDVSALVKRRHLGEVLADVVGALRSTAAATGVGLAQAPVRARRLLATTLQLLTGRNASPARSSPPPPSPTATPPTASHRGRRESRGPPSH